MANQRSFQVRRSRPSDRRDVERLFAEVFGRRFGIRGVDGAGWGWKYAAKPWGAAMGVVAESEEGIVGHIAAVQRSIESSTGSVAGAVYVDAATRATFRQHGVFHALCSRMDAELQSAGVAVAIAFPTRATTKHLLFDNLGWKPVVADCGMIRMRVNLMSRNRGRQQEFEVVESRGLPSSLDELLARSGDGAPWHLARNRDYLTWRYFANCAFPYRSLALYEGGELVAWSVLRVVQKSSLKILVIMDAAILAGRDDVARGMVACVGEVGARERVVATTAMAGGGCMLRGVLVGCGYRKTWLLGARKIGLAAKILAPTCPLSVVQDDWSIAWGDTDVV